MMQAAETHDMDIAMVFVRLFNASPRIEYLSKPNYMGWEQYNHYHRPNQRGD
jgi:hypothetical protein